MIFLLCVREIISKLLFMQEPTNIPEKAIISVVGERTTLLLHARDDDGLICFWSLVVLW